MTTHPEHPADAHGRRPAGYAATGRLEADLPHTHGWDVELVCPACGTVAVPVFEGWTPSRVIRFGNRPTIYADLRCPHCGARQNNTAGAKLVELFAQVKVPEANKRLITYFVAIIVSFELGGTLLLLLGGRRELGEFLVRAPLLLLGPAVLWFNRRVASIRSRCECKSPDHKFMGLLGRSYCYRCSTCGRLLRLRD